VLRSLRVRVCQGGLLLLLADRPVRQFPWAEMERLDEGGKVIFHAAVFVLYG
jgi:hypothetical protein